MGQESLAQKVYEHEGEISELKSEVRGLRRWKDIIREDIKDSMKEIKQENKEGIEDLRNVIEELKEFIIENRDSQNDEIKKANSKLPLWASMFMSIILVVAGWFVEYAFIH